MEPGALDFILRRDRLVVGACLLIVSVGAWLYILSGAGMDMSMLEMTHPGETGMDMDMVMPQAWSTGYAVMMFFMWWIMMVAMMLPSATPTILLSAALNRRSSSEIPPYGSAAVFTFGYLLAWAVFSLAAVLFHWLLEQAGLLSMLMVEFLVRHRRPGNRGALLMGLHHGYYCLGCCWFLMALLFVGGVMNLYWIIGLAVFVYLEKTLTNAKWLSQVAGAALVVWGILYVSGVA
jgi:predicted metal-binding membrane protein